MVQLKGVCNNIRNCMVRS